MPTKVRSRSKLKRIRSEGVEYLLIELDRTTAFDGKYTNIIYDIADGDLNDPATNIERRLATFEGQPPASLKSDGDDRYGWSAVDGALIDVVLETVQEEDDAASRHRSQEASLLDKDGYQGWNQPSTEEFEAFWAAVEAVAKDESDEDAWAVIDRWRSRQLRREER